MASIAGQNNNEADSKSNLKPLGKSDNQDEMEVQVKATQSQFDTDALYGINVYQNDNKGANGVFKGQEAEELSKLDREELERRCMVELIAQHEEEKKLRETFEACYDAFDFWSQAGLTKTNERASKRLKTLANFVEMSEEDIKVKKAHHKAVVDAFKQALTLIPKRMG